MRATAVKGTRDFLPGQAELRDYMQRQILRTYRDCGFGQIITPVLEDIDNLTNSDGGDNLNLMFKVLKRGNTLSAAITNRQFDALSDLGLRYDLTLPLCRYFANNQSKLRMPLKCVQIGNAYRAENPQKGRYREFVQCDIDIVGVESHWAEVELITTTATALMSLGIGDFRVRINDRRILAQLFSRFGFSQTQMPGLCVIFDKLDKIGAEGIERELGAKAYDQAACSRLLAYIREGDYSLRACAGLIGESAYLRDIEKIAETVNQIAGARYRCEFDISLVRGQGYYTGAVFEIESLAYSGSLAGGGRYDNLIGKFVNEPVPAVGFSIGFERIFDLLLEQGFSIPDQKAKIAVFFDEDYALAHQAAAKLKDAYQVCLLEKPRKLGRVLSQLQNDGYAGYCRATLPPEPVFFSKPESVG